MPKEPKTIFRTTEELQRRLRMVTAAYGLTIDAFCHEAVLKAVTEMEIQLSRDLAERIAQSLPKAS